MALTGFLMLIGVQNHLLIKFETALILWIY